MAMSNGLRSCASKLPASPESFIFKSVNRGFHSSGVKRLGGYAHGHEEPFYLHARQMHNLDVMKHQKRNMSYYMNRLFPKSNSSFPLSSGISLKSDVLRLREETFLVDTGLGTPRMCMQDELTRVPTNPATTRFENNVGCLELVAGESLIREHILERFFIDLVAGESLAKQRAAARFNDLVGSTDAVAGEPHLVLPRRFRQKRARFELDRIFRANSKVKGFIIEKVRGGYAVAIAGFVAFLPMRLLRPNRFSSDRFVIERFRPRGKDFVVL